MSEQMTYIVLGMMSVLTLKITCFILGYLIVKIGAGLLRDGITGEFKFNAELPGVKGDLVSASPGLLFLVIGALVIGYAIWVPKESKYRSGEGASSIESANKSEPAPNTMLP